MLNRKYLYPKESPLFYAFIAAEFSVKANESPNFRYEILREKKSGFFVQMNFIWKLEEKVSIKVGLFGHPNT